jgi:DNA-binding response OmpR family regulator
MSIGNTEGGEPPRRARVLAVAGDVDTLSLVRVIFERAGHDVLTAATGGEAERLLLSLDGWSLDLVVAAAVLPDGDGVVLAVALGRRLGCRTLTLCPGESDARRSERAGVDTHLFEHSVLIGLGHAARVLSGRQTGS